MNPLDRMQIFARVAELSSFTQAAQVLGLPKASASLAVQQLEAHLGTRLLHRTTRRVQLTQDGQAFYERCKDLLDDVDELQAMFQQPDGTALRGRVRIDMSTGIARQLVLPALPDLLARHPLLEVELSSTDRRVDLVREGFDCVIRVGSVQQEGVIAKKIGHFKMLNCASPSYIAKYGKPSSLEELSQGHKLIHYVGQLGGSDSGFEYLSPDNHELCALALPKLITVNNADAYSAACLAGLGIIQAPNIGVAKYLQTGELIEILPDYPAPSMPVSLLYPHRRHLSKRLQVFMAWLTELLTPFLVSR